MPTPAPLRGLVRSFLHRNFRLFYGGQLISLIGTWMQSTAQAWLVYRLTGSSLSLGLVGFATQFPVFLLTLLGGAVADTVDRRRLLLATQMASLVQATVLAGLTLAGNIQVWQVIALAACLGVINAVDIPVRQAFLSELVAKEDLPNAIGLSSSMVHTARVVGPSAAGLLLATVGEGWCFALNAVSYLAVLASLLALRVTPRSRPLSAGTVWTRVGEGVRYAWHHREVAALLVLVGIGSLLGSCYIVLMPVFAAEVLRGGPRELGWLMATAGAGSLTGALILASLRQGRNLWRLRFWAGLAFGLSVCAFALSRSLWLSLLLLPPVGCSMVLVMATSNTLLQLHVPDALRGRVMSLFSFMFMGMAPFGAMLSGWLAHLWGAPLAVTLCGGACALAALILGRVAPRAPGHLARS